MAVHERVEQHGDARVHYRHLVHVSDKTVMTPTMVELEVGLNSEGVGGTWIGILYERGGYPNEYPLAGVVFQATEIVFERVFIAD